MIIPSDNVSRVNAFAVILVVPPDSVATKVPVPPTYASL